MTARGAAQGGQLAAA